MILYHETAVFVDKKRLKTTPFHPQYYGQSEKTFQTVKIFIKSYFDENQLTCDENLSKYAYVYNTSEYDAPKHQFLNLCLDVNLSYQLIFSYLILI